MLSVLLGDDAQGLSPAVVSHLKAEWAKPTPPGTAATWWWGSATSMCGPTAFIRRCAAKAIGFAC